MLHAAGQYYEKKSLFNDNFFVNVCGEASCAGGACGCVPPGNAVCQLGSNNVWYSCGLYATQNITTMTSPLGVKIQYGGGKPCGSTPRSSTLLIACNEAVTVKFLSVMENINCQYALEFQSKYACPKRSSLSGGSVFLLIFFLGGGLYFGGGFVYNWKVKHLEGVERIPQYAFWSMIPGLIVDGVFFTKNKLLALINRN
jgi:hypothetical protein